MAVKADDVLHPDEIEDTFDWEKAASSGEHLDEATRSSISLAHRAIDKFPQLKGRYKTYAGAAVVVSSAATLMAAIALSRKMKKGGISADKALAALTMLDIENAERSAGRFQRYRRLLRKVGRGGNGASPASE
jgi:hypothetical protein